MSATRGTTEGGRGGTSANSRRRRPVLRWLGLSALLVVLALAGVIGAVLGTQAGLRLAVDLAAGAVPGMEKPIVTGSLVGPLEIRGFRLKAGFGAVAVERVAFAWRPAALLSGTLHIVHLDVEGVRFAPAETAEPPPEPAEPFAMPEIRLPLAVVVERLRVADARLEREGMPPLQELLLRARAGGTRVDLEELRILSPGVRVAAHGGIDLGPGAPADLALDWSWEPPGRQALRGEGRVAGPIGDLRIEHRVTGAADVALNAKVTGLPGTPRWDARLDLARVEPAQLVAGVPPLKVSGRLVTRGEPTDLSVEGWIDVQEEQLGALRLDLAAQVAGDRVEVTRLEAREQDGKAVVSATASAQLGDDPAFQAAAEWSALRWPIKGEAVAQTPEGRFAAEGRLSAFRFDGQGRVLAKDAPPTAFALKGTGDAAGARIEGLRLELLEGQIDLGGTVGWAPEPRWDLKVTLDGINPGAQWGDWPGRLKGALESRGRLALAGPQVDVEVGAIEGKLRGYPVRVSASARVEGSEAAIDRLSLASGDAHLEAKGKAGEVLDLAWSVSAPRLEQLLPDATGSLRGEGRVSGPAKQPHVVARLEGSALKVQQHGVAVLKLDADVDLAGPKAPLKLDLDAGGVESGGKKVGDLKVEGRGSQASHRLALELRGGELGVGGALALSGGLRDDGSWAGRLERTDLRTPGLGDWRLAAPADLQFGKTARLAPLCLSSGEARVCAEGSLADDQSWKGKLDARALPLALAQPFLPKDVFVSGAASLEAEAAGKADGSIRGDARLGLPGARVRVPMGAERRDIDLSQTTLQARIDGKGAKADLKLVAGELANASAQVELPGWTAAADPKKQRIAGKLKAQVPDLAWVKAFAPDLGKVEGRVALDLAVGGTLGDPRITGEGGLTNGRVEVPDAGLNLRDLRFAARSQGADRVVYDGGAKSGDGTLRITGETRLVPRDGWPTRVEIKGENFVAADTPEYLALVSPALTVRHGVDGASVEGEVVIPRTRIRPRALPEGTVKPSSDVRIKGKPKEEAGAGLPLTIRVRIRFGDQVHIDAFKLRGRFEGNLLVEQKPGKDPVGNGRLGIVDGTYAGLGRDLKIEKGAVNYASSPLDNPGLDVRAVAVTGEVSAGLTLTGTAREPKIELFSKPPRPQSEILSYLLFGKPLSGTGSKEEKSSMGGAAAAVGSSMLAAEVGRQLGLDELAVSGAGDKAQLTVGQYVTPQLYLQYVSGLRSSINRLRIRYDVTKWLQLQTETGDQQGADVFYILER
jgi:translocation and assembly module TamB